MELKPGYKQTEVGMIPEDWDVKCLREISPSQSVGLVINPSSYFETNGEVPMLVGSCISENKINAEKASQISRKNSERLSACRLKTGDLVTVRVGFPGTTAVVPTELDGCNCASMMIIRGHKSFDSYWLAQLLNSPIGRGQIENVEYGTAQKKFNISDAINFSFPVPPAAEQIKIAEAAKNFDQYIESLEQKIDKKCQVKQAAMQELLTGKRRLPGFSGEWEEVQLGDIAAIRNTKAVASSMPAQTECVELECIEQGTGRLLMSNHASGESTKYSFRTGDVLFGRLRAYLRKFWLASFDGICSTEIWPLIARDDRLSADFLHLLVQTSEFIDAACVSYGTHMPRSDWAVLKKFQLRLPLIPEQKAIATVLADIDAELSDLVQRSQKAAFLKQGMMQQLLTGKIRLT
jgi:type I restriction enzyme S subunit